MGELLTPVMRRDPRHGTDSHTKLICPRSGTTTREDSAAMKSPGRMICHGCNDDLGTSGYDEEAGVWLYPCPSCRGVDGPLTIEVPGDLGRGRGARGGNGILAQLGVYDGVKEALGQRPDEWLEFAVLEHLYAKVDHEAYRKLVERYGHVALKPDTHTASWMIGRAAWALRSDGELANQRMPCGTGRWSYLTPAYAWAKTGTSGNAPLVTWETFARDQGFDPATHPAIDWRPTPNAPPGVGSR
jgi:hypothetical protein